VTQTLGRPERVDVEYVRTPYPGRAVAILRGDGSGGFGSLELVDTGGAAPDSVALADVTGEGTPDLVVANTRSGELAVLAGDGTGSFAPPVRFDAGGLFPAAVAVADVNGDGALDLLAFGGPGSRARGYTVLERRAAGSLTVSLNTNLLARTTGGLLG
jgi:hypothetical protein